MSDSQKKYFNFPMVLLQGFIKNHKKCLDNITDYAIYLKVQEYESKDGFEWIEAKGETKALELAESYFSLTVGNKQRTLINGKKLQDRIPTNCPKVGLNMEIFWDYYKNEKTDFQKACLLGFLALKSILQSKAYCKMENKFWLSRMDGKAKSIKTYDDLSPEIRKYANEYQTRKIKTELIHNWGLEHYSRYTRGFYVSFKLSQGELIYEAEKRRKSTKEKQRKFSEQIAIKKALSRLNNQNNGR